MNFTYNKYIKEHNSISINFFYTKSITFNKNI